jgi:cardiolipin synthase
MCRSLRNVCKVTICFLMVLLVGFGCTTDRVVRSEEETISFEAEDVYFDGEKLFVKYKLGERCCYAAGNRAESVDPMIVSVSGDTSVDSVLLPLEELSEDPWDDKPEDLPVVHVFHKSDWKEYLKVIFQIIIPRETGQGCLVDISNREYFLFYDEEGRPRVTLVQNKPGNIRIKKVWNLEDILNIGLPLLEEYLEKKEVDENQVVFNTGDTGLYSYPFVFIDLNRKLVLFAQVNPTTIMASRLFSGKDVQSTSHFVGSHAAIIVRPVSALGRLFYGLYDTSLDLVESGGDLGEQIFIQPFKSGGQYKPVVPLSDGPGMNIQEWEQWLDRFTVQGSSTGTIEYHIDGEQFFPRFIDAMTMAQESIHIRTYIFDNDDYAIKIADILKEKSRNAEVKVLMDGLGTILATKAHAEDMPLSHEAPESVSGYLENDSKVKARLQTNPWLSMDHSKLIVLDGRTAFVGGMNIGREYRYHRHDLMLELHGPVVDILQKEFHQAWAHAGALGDLGYFFQSFRHPDKNVDEDGYPVRVLHSRAAEPEIYLAQLEAIKRAKRYIFIENMYVIQDTIIEELVKARRRGVDVRIIIPLEGYMGPFDRANILGANLLLENGVRVYVYPGQLHAKAAIYDGWACVGSANLDKASFKRNRELNIATSHPEAVNELLEQLFLPDFKMSKEVIERIPQKWSDRLSEMLTDQL